jgi:hypothetical protein
VEKGDTLHGMETSLPFVDLVKTFNTINKIFIFRIMRKYGIPEEVIEVAKGMYMDWNVQVNIL